MFHVLASVLRMIACAPHPLWKEGGLFERKKQNFFEKKMPAGFDGLISAKEVFQFLTMLTDVGIHFFDSIIQR